MNKFSGIFQLILILLLSSCNGGGGATKIDIDIKKPRPLNTTLTSVSVVNDRIIIRGSGFENVTSVSLRGPETSGTLTVESVTATEIIAYAASAVGIGINKTLDLLISNAEAQAGYQITFNLDDNSVTSQKINDMGATPGQVLKYNGTNWVPGSLPNSQLYLGSFDAFNNVPDLSSPSSTPGDYFIVSQAGTFNGITYAIGDWIISDGTAWQKIATTQPMVNSFEGRMGNIVLIPSDYVSLKDPVTQKLTGSSLSDIADVDVSGLAANKILKYDGSQWIVADDLNGGGAGSVSTTQLQDGAVTYQKMALADGDVPKAKISGLVTELGTITTSLSGKITLTNLSGTSPLSYNSATGVFSIQASSPTQDGTLSAADKSKLDDLEILPLTNGILERFSGVLRTQTCTSGEVLKWNVVAGWMCASDLASDATKLPLTGGTLSGDLTLETNLKLKDGASANYVTLNAPASGTTSYTLTFPASLGANNQVLTTNASGILSWSTVATSATSVGGDLSGTIASSTIVNDAVTSAKILDGTIANADINAAAAIAQSKIANLTTDLSTINTSLSGKIGLANLSATAPLVYNNTTGAFTVNAATTVLPGTMSAADKTKLDTVTATELGFVSGVTSAVQDQLDDKFNIAGGSLTGDLTLETNLKLKDRASANYVTLTAPASGTTSYTLTFPTTVGTNNQVLTTNASGVLSWSTVATSSTAVGGDLSGTISSAVIVNDAVTGAKILDGTIANADINAAAAIAQSKIANLVSDFATVNSTLSGKIGLTNLSATAPLVYNNTTGAFTVSSATTALPGTMSAADKTKLDSVSAAELGHVAGVTSDLQTQLNNKVDLGGGTITGDLAIETNLKLKDGSSSNFVTLRAPAAGTTSYTLTFPSSVGAANQVLTTNASGVLSWTSIGSSTAVGGDLTGTVANAVIGNDAVTSTKILDDAIMNADVNASAAIAQSKIANLTTDLSTINTSLSGKIGLTNLSASAPLVYNNTTGTFTVDAATTTLPGTMSAADKTKINTLEALSAGNGIFERFSGVIRSNTCSSGEVLKWNAVTGWTCGADLATDATKLPLAGGTLTGNLVLDTELQLKDGSSSNYVTLKAPASGTTSYTLTFPASVGGNNQVLTTNASGVLSWSTVATSATAVGGDLSGTIANSTVVNDAITSAKILDGTIVNADINASAAIAQSKIANLVSDFATVNTLLSGKIGLANLSATAPLVYNNTTGAFTVSAATIALPGTMSAADKTKLDAVTATELGFVSGVTSAIQDQLDDKLNLAGGTLSGDLTLETNLKLKDGASANYVTLRAPVSGTSSYTLTFPSAVGGNNQVLTTNASGVLSWTTVATSSTAVGGDLSGTIASSTIVNDAITSAKILDGTIANADINAAAAIAQSKIANLTTDLSTINTSLSGKIDLSNLSATAPLVYNNTTGAFTVDAATIALPGTMSAADKTKIDTLEALSAGNGIFERFSGVIRSNTCSSGEVLKWNAVTGWTCGADLATDATKLPLAGGTLTGDLTLETNLKLKDGASANYVTLMAPASGTTSYTLTFPSAVGGNNQVLTTNASGVLSWTTVATSATAVGGDLSGTIANATIANDAITSAKIIDGAIVNADINATAAIAQSKIANLVSDFTTINSSLSGKIGLANLSATAPLVYNNTTGAFTVNASTTALPGTMSAADKTKLDTVSATELGYLSGVTSGVQTQIADKLPLAGGTMSGDLTLETSLKLKDGASANYVNLRAPASGTTSYTLTFPSAVGGNNQVLTTNASGILSWSTVATSATAVGGDLSGTIASSTIVNDAVTSVKILDGAIVNADINASAAIAQSKIANLTTDLSTINTSLSGKISLTNLSATAPLVYNNTTGAFTVNASTNALPGTMSAADKTKIDTLEALSAGNGVFERFSGVIRSNTCSSGEVLKWNAVTGWTCGADLATDATKLPLAGGTLTGDLTLETNLKLKDGASANYVSLIAPASGTTSYTLTFPTTVGTNNQVLTTNASGVLSWSTVATSSTAVGGDLSGTISSAVILNDAVTGAKILDGTIANADINASAAIAQSKIANLVSDFAAVNSSLSGKIGLTNLTATPPLVYNNTTGAFTVNAATTSLPGTLSAADKTKLDSVTATELGYLSGVTSGIQTQIADKLPLAGGTLSGDLTLETSLKLKDGASANYVNLRAPASGTTSYTLTFPATVGSANQVLTTNASGVLSWMTIGTSTAVGGDLTGTIANAVIATDAVTSAKILDGAIVNADINASAAIAQSKIANLTTDLSTINTSLSGKIGLTNLSATAPLVYNNTTGAFTVDAATTALPGTMSASDKTKIDTLEALSAGNGIFERFSGVIRSNTCSSGEVLKWNAVTGWTCGADLATDATKLPLAGGTLTGDLTLETNLKLKDGASANYVTLMAPASGTTSYTLTFPSAVGGNNQVLTTNASGVLSWSTVATSATAVGGDLSGTIASATIVNDAVTSGKILDGTIVNADINAAAAIAQSKIANLVSDFTTINSSLSGKIGLANLSATAPLVYNNTTGAFTVNASTTALPGTMSAADKTKLDSVSSTELGYLSGVTSGIQTQISDKLPLGGGTLSGDLSLETSLKLKDGASANFVTLRAPASGTTSYALTFPTAIGSANQVLTTNASGVLSWMTIGTSTAVGGDLTGTIANAVIATDAVTSAKILDGTIANADINVSAAIAQSKIANLVSDFATVNSSLSGKIDLTNLSATAPLVYNNTTGAFTVNASTTALPGTMSAADKTKIDTLEALSAGNGIFERFSGVIRSNTCSSGEVLKWNAVTGWTCGADLATDATKLPLAGGTLTGDLTLETNLKLKDGASANYVTLMAPASGTTSYTLTFPLAVGGNNQVLTTNASGVLSWTTVATSATAVGGDLSGTIANATIANDAITSAKIIDGAIVNADINATAAIAQSKIANLVSDFTTINSSLSGKIRLTDLSATAPLVYNNTTGAFTVNAATTALPGTMSATDKTKLDTVSATELGYLSGVTSGIQTQIDNKLPLAGGSLSGDLTLETSLRLKDGASANYVNLRAPASGTTSYTLTFPAAVGSANQVLTTNASGVLSWSTVATSATAVGGDLAGTIASSTIVNDAVTSIKILDGAIVNADINTSAAIAQSKIANLTTDLSTINTSLSGKIGLTDLSATAPLVYNNTTGAFTVNASTTALPGTMSAADKTKIDTLEALSAGNGLFERFSGVIRSNTCSSGEVLKWNAVTGWTCGADLATDATKLPLAGGTLTGDLTLETNLKLKDGASANYVTLRAPASGTTSYTLTFPSAVGGNNQVLTTNASGVLSWSTVATSATAVGGDLSGTIASSTIVNDAITSAKILDGTIVNADINATAAIEQSKIANLVSDFTTINTSLSGKIGLTNLSVTAPLVYNNTTGAFTVNASTTALPGTMSAADKTKLDTVSATELGYLSGVTSGIQTQVNSKLPLAGGTLTGDLTLETNLKLKDGASANYVNLRAPASGTTSYTLTFPAAVGTANQVLTTNATGVLSWTSIGTSTAVGGDLTGTVANAVIAGDAVTSAKIIDGAIVNADINASAAIAQSKIANLTTDLAGKIGLTSLSATAPLVYNNTTGAFTVSAATTTTAGTLSGADKTKVDALEILSAGSGIFERFSGSIRSNTCAAGEVLAWNVVSGWSCSAVVSAALGTVATSTTAIATGDSIATAFNKTQGQMDLKSPIASPTFTGTPAAPTAAVGTNTTQIATTAYVTTANPTLTMLSADVTNSTTTIADVTGLSFAVSANVTYEFEFYISYTSAATATGSRWTINGPATTFLHYESEYSLTATSKTFNTGLTAYASPATGNATSAATAGNTAVIRGIIRPSAAGTLIARFNSEVAASAVIAKGGRSYVRFKAIN